MISVGMVLGGPERTEFDAQVRKFMKYMSEHGLRAEYKVVINYHLPGKLLRPDFHGVLPGSFSKKDKRQVVSVAVEEEIAILTDIKQIRKYVYETADEAIGAGKTVFERKKINYDLDKARQLLDAWYASE